MAVEESDNITKNIVQEIIRECTKLELDIDENFCTYYVKLLTLDPVWKISPEKKINREYIQILVSFIKEKLKQTDSISLTTLKLQQLFSLQFLKRDVIISNKRQVLLNCVEPLLENILHFNVDENNKSRFFKRISIYIASVTFLGNPKNITVLRETVHALKSIFNDDDMDYFSNCKPDERFPYLNMLVKVVMGIRLYNNFSGRLCTDMADLPKLLPSVVRNMQIEINNALESIMENVNITTTAIESLFSLQYENEDDEEERCYMKLKLPENITEEDLFNTYDTLILYLQQQIYLEKLRNEVKTIYSSLSQWTDDLHQVLLTLNCTIKYQIAISTAIVFPLFTEVADIWIKLQNITLVMCEYLVLLEKLKTVAVKGVTIEKLQTMTGSNPVVNSLHRKQRSENFKIDKSNLGSCELIEESNSNSVDYFELSGFCIWTFIETQGALIAGNAHMGIIKWNERYYIFAHPEAARIFATRPESFIRRCLDIVRKKPELINLLQLYQQIYEVRDIETLHRKSLQIPKNEKVIQTDIHPIPAYIDNTYIWNNWELLRKATSLANAVRSKTHASQTKTTHFKNPVCTQTSILKNKYCQTKKDNYASTPTPSAFIFGLRGRHDNVQHLISLNSQTGENTCDYESSSIKTYHWNDETRKKKRDTIIANITTKIEESSTTSPKNSCSCED